MTVGKIEKRGEADRESGLALARIDGDRRPSPIPGMDSRTFSNWITRALAGDATVPPVILGRMTAARRGASDDEERDAEWWRDYFWQEVINDRLRDINGLIDRYNEMADWHHAQAELARERMREATDKLAEIDEFMAESDDVTDKLEKTGKLDREEAIRLLRSRGIDVDPNEDDRSIAAKLRAERDKADSQRIEWRRRYEDAGSDADYHDEQERENRRRAQELVERRDTIRNGAYSPEEEERRLREVSDEYEADVRRKAYEIEKGKIAETKSEQEIVTEAQPEINKPKAHDEEADFWASARDLTGDFGKVADVAKATPENPPAVRNVPAPGGPASSV